MASKRKPSKQQRRERALKGWETRRKEQKRLEREAKKRSQNAKRAAAARWSPAGRLDKKEPIHKIKAKKAPKRVILELEQKRKREKQLRKENERLRRALEDIKAKRRKDQRKRQQERITSKFISQRERERAKAEKLGMLGYIQWLIQDGEKRGIPLEASYMEIAQITGEEPREIFCIGRGSPSLKYAS